MPVNECRRPFEDDIGERVIAKRIRLNFLSILRQNEPGQLVVTEPRMRNREKILPQPQGLQFVVHKRSVFDQGNVLRDTHVFQLIESERVKPDDR